VKKYGFGGAAILGALWNKFDLCTTNNYDDLIEHFKKLKKLAD
jgi:thiamine-phosphate pyrophosphorylase